MYRTNDDDESHGNAPVCCVVGVVYMADCCVEPDREVSSIGSGDVYENRELEVPPNFPISIPPVLRVPNPHATVQSPN